MYRARGRQETGLHTHGAHALFVFGKGQYATVSSDKVQSIGGSDQAVENRQAIQVVLRQLLAIVGGHGPGYPRGAPPTKRRFEGLS